MRIKTLTAAKMEDALRLIRTELGPEALILSTRKVKGENGQPTLEITAAIADEALPPTPRTSTAVTPADEAGVPAAPSRGTKTTHPLAEHGLPTPLITRIEAALPGLASAGFTGADALEMLLAKLIRFQSVAELVPAGRAHLLIGPHGAGKTTLVSRLAIAARQQGRTVGLLSLDDQKIGGFEQLSIVAEILQESAHLLTTKADLAAATQSLGPRHMLLIDTPGLNPYQPHTTAQLQQRLNQLGIATMAHLVLPATLNGAEMAALPVACHGFNLTSIMFTQLDTTTRYGALVATAEGAGLPIGVASHSADISVPPFALTARWLAEALSTPPHQPWEFAA